MKRLLPVLLMMLVSACATNTRITNSWRDADYTGSVSAGAGDGRRRGWCQSAGLRGSVRSDPQAAGVTAIPSYSLVSGLSESDLPAVKAAVARSGADGVLTTRLVGVDKRTPSIPRSR